MVIFRHGMSFVTHSSNFLGTFSPTLSPKGEVSKGNLEREGTEERSGV